VIFERNQKRKAKLIPLLANASNPNSFSKRLRHKHKAHAQGHHLFRFLLEKVCIGVPQILSFFSFFF
jgi:hypothetical protein